MAKSNLDCWKETSFIKSAPPQGHQSARESAVSVAPRSSKFILSDQSEFQLRQQWAARFDGEMPTFRQTAGQQSRGPIRGRNVFPEYPGVCGQQISVRAWCGAGGASYDRTITEQFCKFGWWADFSSSALVIINQNPDQKRTERFRKTTCRFSAFDYALY